MKRHLVVILWVIVATVSSGCIGWRFGPGFSAHDTSYFAAPPKIVKTDSGYALAWTFGKDAFPFFPSYRVKEGRLVFSVQGMSSAWPVNGRYHEMAITGADAESAIRARQVFWWQPDGALLRLEIESDEYSDEKAQSSLPTPES